MLMYVCVNLLHFSVSCAPAQQRHVVLIVLFIVAFIVGWVRDLIGYDSHI